MKILSVGPFSGHQRNNTAAHRSDCLRHHADEYFEELDTHASTTLWFRLLNRLSYYGLKFNLPDTAHVNQRLLRAAAAHEFDIIWIDKGSVVRPETLRRLKQLQPQCKLVHYMIDDIMNPYHSSKQILDTIPCYDYYIMNRQANRQELLDRGCKHPIITYMSYESRFHYPRQVSPDDVKRLGGDVGFIGTFEQERANSILYLAHHGLPVRVWGDGWAHLKGTPNLQIEGKGIFNEDFCKAIGAFKINLAFLRKKSRDLHTTRSSEIPACGGFMLAERTEEHLAMFEEGKEAAFFSSDEELLEKCRYYLSHDEERLRIAEAGTLRCKTSDYSNEGMIRKVLQEICAG